MTTDLPTSQQVSMADVMAELQRLRDELARAAPDRQTAPGSLKTEETGGDPQPRGDAMAKVVVFEDRKKWKVRLTDKESGKTKTTTYETESEARKQAPRLLAEYERPKGRTIPLALAAYAEHLAAGGVTGGHPNKPRTIETTLGRLQGVLGGIAGVTGGITTTTAEAAWLAFTNRAVNKAGKLPTTDTKANTLKQLRTFFRWLNQQGWLAGDPLAGMKVVGQRKRGKPKLAGVDEAKKFLDTALGLARGGDTGALAAATALYLGLRASEVTNRLVRDLDANGTVLVVTNAKTEAGNRRVRVPAVLQGLLRELAIGKAPTHRLFGTEANRHWLLRAVDRVCLVAGVSRVTPHGLRGTHAELAVGAGLSGEAIAASLGHESFVTTERHYAGSDSVAGASADRFLAALN